MRISKVLNNNVIISVSEETGQEVVVMGKGLAFGKSKGDLVEKDKIEKIFTLKDGSESSKFQQMLENIPQEVVEISEKIISYSEEKLGRQLENNIHLALADHLAFAINRFSKGYQIKNYLLWEIKKLYNKEFQIGLWALKLIEEKFNIQMPEDEAGFIALHIINATMGESMTNTIDITNMVQELLNLIKYYLKVELNTGSLYYDRLVTHIRFFAQRVISKKTASVSETPFYEMMRENYSQAFSCALKIKEYVEKNYDYLLGKDEIVYLCLHLQRVIDESKREN
ncbi:BglG family transcription antiterminator LicT [Anaerobranca gottschalkii]|uniref:Transcriptional antiterminator, BglG family n=1 Tax=Anaerobranca gottschalkii DSM 13577 TaxID=1120990 RepID=A0A1I0C7E4_9FIRM|nr:PRD domain-containing protein [Anaerobranca gottschalkii]SET14860.1 transcriptional antiterminator, BglG family [Anaerobranca gottschalkii DSM 13577]